MMRGSHMSPLNQLYQKQTKKKPRALEGARMWKNQSTKQIYKFVNCCLGVETTISKILNMLRIFPTIQPFQEPFKN